MKGVVLTIAVDGLILKRAHPAPSLELLKKGIGGGHIEIVPYFDTILIEGELKRCRAFCDEDGKRKGLPFNASAQALWVMAAQRHGLDANKDRLVGQICVVYGDQAWMRKL